MVVPFVLFGLVSNLVSSLAVRPVFLPSKPRWAPGRWPGNSPLLRGWCLPISSISPRGANGRRPRWACSGWLLSGGDVAPSWWTPPVLPCWTLLWTFYLDRDLTPLWHRSGRPRLALPTLPFLLVFLLLYLDLFAFSLMRPSPAFVFLIFLAFGPPVAMSPFSRPAAPFFLLSFFSSEQGWSLVVLLGRHARLLSHRCESQGFRTPGGNGSPRRSSQGKYPGQTAP